MRRPATIELGQGFRISRGLAQQLGLRALDQSPGVGALHTPPRDGCAGGPAPGDYAPCARRVQSGWPPRTSQKPAWRLWSYTAGARNFARKMLGSGLID